MALRVLLIYPHRQLVPGRELGAGYHSPHIGLAYLAAVLSARGHDVEILDGEAENLTASQVRERVGAVRPAIVGITAFTHQVPEAGEAAAAAKKAHPSALTVLGGCHATALPAGTLEEFPGIDACAFGEGEVTMAELAEAVESRRGFEGIDGIAYRENEKTIKNPQRKLIDDLDILPFPEFGGFKLNLYRGFYTHDPRLVELPVSASRGCPFQCTFCTKVMGSRLRHRSAERAVEEIGRDLEQFGARQVIFTDESFTANEKWLARFCELYIASGLNKKVNWIIESRVDIQKETIFLMKEANCSHITFGVESGNQEILDKNKKRISLEQSRNAIRWAHEAGIITDGNFILGLPYETLGTIRDTVRFAVRSQLDYASFFLLVPYPGSEAMKLAERGEANLRLLSRDWTNYGKQVGAAVTLKGVDRKRLERIQMMAYLRFFLRPRRIAKLFRKVSLRTLLIYFFYQAKRLVSG
ncbi:MAG: radical SAM protein [bacterium]